MNAAPVLSRYVDNMMLPSTFYVGATSLLEFLQIDMHVHSRSVVPPNVTARAKFLEKHSEHAAEAKRPFSRNSKIPRCVMLMAVLIVVIKLRYGLDGIRRREILHPAALSGAAPAEVWLDAVCELHGVPSDRSWDVAPTPMAPWDTTRYVLLLTQ